MLNKRFKFNNFTITIREIIVSCCILFIGLWLGLLFSANIEEFEMLNNEKYNKALKIEDQSLFRHGMDTNIGNAFIYGTLKAVDTVSYPEIKGEYIYLKKVEERYERHESWIEKKDSEGNTTRRKKVWYSWDVEGSESLHSNKILFCNIEFPYEKIDICNSINSDYIDTIYDGYTWSTYSGESVKVRYVYYGKGTEFTGTIFTELGNQTISDNTRFYNNMNIDQTVDKYESSDGSMWFWIIWFILIVIVIYAFYYADNKWLD